MRVQSALRRLYFSFLKHTSTHTVYCLGDSHIRVFNHPLFKVYFPLTYFDITAVDGATASGLKNPNSKTQASKIFYTKLDSLAQGSTVLFCLGEVDTGYVIWWRAKKYKTAIGEMLAQAVKNYEVLITYAANRHKVLVLSAPLPTIPDDKQCGKVAEMRRDITATQSERTDLTLRFNAQIREFCSSQQIPYMNLDPFSLDPATNLVLDVLKNPNATDHHYDKRAYAQLIIQQLRKQPSFLK